MANSFAEVAKSMTEDYDVVDVLTMLADCCVKLFGVAWCGGLLSGYSRWQPRGCRGVEPGSSDPRVVGAAVERRSVPRLLQLGEPLLNQSLTAARDRWPTFTPRGLDAGFALSTHSQFGFGGQLIGALNFYCAGEAQLQGAELQAALALADIATIAIVHHHAVRQGTRDE